MGVFWGWGFRKNNDQEVDKIKNDLTKLQTKVETNSTNIVNLENTKATIDYVNSKSITITSRVFNINKDTSFETTLRPNQYPYLVTFEAYDKVFTNWFYSQSNNSFRIMNNTGKDNTFVVYMLEFNR